MHFKWHLVATIQTFFFFIFLFKFQDDKWNWTFELLRMLIMIYALEWEHPDTDFKHCPKSLAGASGRRRDCPKERCVELNKLVKVSLEWFEASRFSMKLVMELILYWLLGRCTSYHEAILFTPWHQHAIVLSGKSHFHSRPHRLYCSLFCVMCI